jgi:hypothetical protein
MTKLVLVLAVGMVLGGGVAQAQQADAWPDAARNIKGSDVFLVTLAEPRRRQKCHVLTDDDGQIECSRHFGKKPTIYQRTGLLAVLRPPFHDHSLLISLIPLSIGGGIIWGAVVLSSITIVGAVPVAMVGSVVVLIGLMAGTFQDPDQPEVVLYLKPGEALPFALRR